MRATGESTPLGDRRHRYTHIICFDNFSVIFNYILIADTDNAVPVPGRRSHTMSEPAARGQIGIGTLIVFIAMVLVAAIAAGVLINTAGLLQAQAQTTGEEVTAEVSNVIQIKSAIGEETTNSGEVDVLNISVRLTPGSDAINLSKSSYTLEVDGNATVVNGNDAVSSGVSYHAVRGFDDSENTTLADQADLINARFDLTEIQGVSQLDEQTTVRFVAIAPDGGSTYKEFKAPNRILNGESYIL